MPPAHEKKLSSRSMHEASIPDAPMPDPAKSSHAYNSHAGTGSPLDFFILRALLLLLATGS